MYKSVVQRKTKYKVVVKLKNPKSYVCLRNGVHNVCNTVRQHSTHSTHVNGKPLYLILLSLFLLHNKILLYYCIIYPESIDKPISFRIICNLNLNIFNVQTGLYVPTQTEILVPPLLLHWTCVQSSCRITCNTMCDELQCGVLWSYEYLVKYKIKTSCSTFKYYRKLQRTKIS